MKKRKKSKVLQACPIKNPVAKYAFQFNKAQIFKDKRKYQRNAKHKGQEPFPMILMSVIGKGFCFSKALRSHNSVRQTAFGLVLSSN